MTATQMVNVEDWTDYKVDARELTASKLEELVEASGKDATLQQTSSKAKNNKLLLNTTIDPHGKIIIALVETFTDIDARVVAEQNDHGEVYHSDSDSTVHVEGINGEGQILQKTERLIEQAGQRAVAALTRDLDHEKQRKLIKTITSSVGDVSEGERTPEGLDIPAKMVLGRTRANDYIPADDPWHLRFVLQGLKQMKGKLSAEDNISDISLDIETPEEAERFDWLASAFGRYSYLAHYYDGPQGVVQKANEHTDEHDYQVELRRAVEWEAEQIGFYLENVLGKNYGRFYEYLDRETGFNGGTAS